MFDIKKRNDDISLFQIEKDILNSRGVFDLDEFKNPSKSNIESYNLFDNIQEAVQVAVTHFNKKDDVYILIDSDPDGYTSSALLYQYIINHIPTHGNIHLNLHEAKQHGLYDSIVTDILNNDCKLLFLPDSGTNDYKWCKILKDNGVDVIILDHHLKEHENENAIIINNHTSDNVTDKSMTGVGVTYKFCKALDNEYDMNYADDYMDLVAIGTIADVADLKNLQSRYYVLKGLELIEDENNGNKFLTELYKSNSYYITNGLTIKDCSYSLIPKINAVIRNGTMSDKEILFEALSGSNRTDLYKVRGKGEIELPIWEIALKICNSKHRTQKTKSKKWADTISEQVLDQHLGDYPIVIKIIDDDVSTSYTGLIANQIASKFQKPCILLRNSNDTTDTVSGSARGYTDSKIKDFNQFCKDLNLFEYTLGHDNAFGVSIKKTNLSTLKNKLETMPYDSGLSYTVDYIFDENTLNPKVVKEIYNLKSCWGSGIAEPLFAVKDIKLSNHDVKVTGKNQNTIVFTYNGISFIKWNSKDCDITEILKYKNFEITMVGECGMSIYDNIMSPQFVIKDFYVTESEVSNMIW